MGRGTLSSPSRPLRCCPLPCPASTIQPQLSRAPHILTLTQIIFQHCTTPRTHTQPSPTSRSWNRNCSVSGWRLGDEAIFHYGGQLTFGKFGFSNSQESGAVFAIHCTHCIHSLTPGCLNLSVYKSCYREGITATGTTLFNTHTNMQV